MAKFMFLKSSQLVQALYDAGVIAEPVDYIRRVVIDLEVGQPARVYVERYGDDDALLAGLTAGLQLEATAEDAGVVGRLERRDV